MAVLLLTNAGALRIAQFITGVSNNFGSGSYFAVFTASPSVTGGGTEATGYTRGDLTGNWAFNAGAGTANATLVDIGGVAMGLTSAPAATVVAWGIFDQPTGGTLLMYSVLDTSITLNAGDLYVFTDSDLHFSVSIP